MTLKQLHDTLVTVRFAGFSQWRAFEPVFRIDVRTVGDKQLNHSYVTLVGRHVQWGVAVAGRRIDVRTLSKQ